MPAIIKRLTGKGLQDVSYSANSLADAAVHEPRAGAYTVSNTYFRTKVLLFDSHLDRLEDSARHEQIAITYDRTQLRANLREMIVNSNFPDVRFRISVPASAPDTLLLSIEPHQPPAPSLLLNGARCITSEKASRRNPVSKASDWMHMRKQMQEAMPPGIYEAILKSAEGFLLEGMSSNFYALVEGRLYTAGAGVLAGISRKIVLEVCQAIVPLRLQAPTIDDLSNFTEAFLTSSSRGIVPIVEIDGQAIGDGLVGETTKSLRKSYQGWVDQHLEEL